MADGAAGFLLKVLAADGSTVRRFHLAAGEHEVGSLAGSAVRLEEAGISRRHARIDVLADGGAVVRDLGSKNGTFVAGRRVSEAAVCGLTLVAFGSVQGVLQPADPARVDVLLGSGDSGGSPTAAGAAAEGLTTQGLHPLERLAETLEEILPSLAAGLASPEEAAEELAHRWLAVLPVGRVEILRRGPAGEGVVAAASAVDAVPRCVAAPEVVGPDGWTLRLRAPASARLAPLAPLFRLALSSLAARRRPLPSPRQAAAGKEPPAEALPPGLGAEMSKLYRRAGKVARGDVPVMILGESGAGKEVLARWLHARSRRAGGPFLAVNCAALPRELLESELFGIEKGVATGVEARPGLLERGSGGTVFLDEVGDMAAETQGKVLRVLENPVLFRVGGRVPVQVDVRFLAATNLDLATRVEEGAFRRDLYHRLAAFEVTLPPLRERREEIPALAARFFHRELAKSGTASPGITRAALAALVRHPWPGNVRELLHEIAQGSLLLEPGEPLDLHHLSPRIRGSRAEPPSLSLDEAVRRAERAAFAVALAAAAGDAARAMEILGIARTTYYRKLKELGLG